MSDKFNLIRFLTVEREKGTIVWLCNIGAEKYWSQSTMGVVDKNEEMIVNRVEEMNLLLCRKQDIIILRKTPDPEFLNTLSEMGFEIPRIFALESEDLITPISELILNNKELLSKLSAEIDSKQDVFFVPYAVTYLEEQIAHIAGLKLIGAKSDICRRVNNKIFNREVSIELGLPVCEGKICYSTDEMRVAYTELTTNSPFFEKVIIKEPTGASGKGLYIIDNKERLDSSLRLISRLSKNKPEICWLVEGWYEKNADLNYQIYISPDGEVTTFSIKQQLLRGTVYIGSKMPVDMQANILHDFERMGTSIGKYLYDIGYSGVAGIDAIITSDNVIIPVIEINGRFTLSTYISFLYRLIPQRAVLSRYFRLLTNKPVSYGEIVHRLKEEGIIFDNNLHSGIFVYTSGTLPHENFEVQGVYAGRLFAIIAAENWEEVESLNQRLQYVVESIMYKESVR